MINAPLPNDQCGVIVLLRLFALLLLTIPAGGLLAQAPYSGGSGDGYGRSFYVYLHGDPAAPMPPVQVYPSVVSQGEPFKILAEGVLNKLEILVYTLQGQLLRRSVAWGIQGSHVQSMDTDGWAAGVYIIDVRRDGRSHRQRLVVLRE